MKTLYTTLTLLILLTVSFFLTSFKTFNENENETNFISTSISEDSLLTEKVKAEKTTEELIFESYQNFSKNNISMPSLPSFRNAMIGFQKLEESNKVKNRILTIVDFTLPSTQKRMWILDMNTNDVLYNTYVSHGRNTGSLMATEFSNISESFQSSLGFYVTGETYYGGNGFSLRIDGMEKGINDNARRRAIVIHGADYATESFMKKYGRLGRSYGCPAIPTELTNEVINLIKGKSVLYIYHTNADYTKNSNMIQMS